MKTCILAILSLATAGCARSKPTAPIVTKTPPASVKQISNELELATVHLTQQAEKRLGVSLAAVQMNTIEARRRYPGVLVVPPHRLTTLSAPVTGRLRYTGPAQLRVGTPVKPSQRLFELVPVVVEDHTLSPTQKESLRSSRLTREQTKAATETRIKNAEVELKAANIDLRRAEQLFDEKVGSRKRVDDAKARSQLAAESLASAQRELKALLGATSDVDTIAPSPLTLVTPLEGCITRVLVAPGQIVSAGQPILEITDVRTLWLRVRVPQSEAHEVNKGAVARIIWEGRSLSAAPIKGFPSADPTTNTVDLYFGLNNNSETLRPDQRIEVALSLRGSGPRRVVPKASVIYDIYGGAWVYLRTKPQDYRRVRVQVDYFNEEGQAILSQGPQVGAHVAVHGTAELFGIEFGND